MHEDVIHTPVGLEFSLGSLNSTEDERVWPNIGEVSVIEYEGAPRETEGRADCLRALNTAAIRHTGPVEVVYASSYGDIYITGQAGIVSVSDSGSVHVNGTCRELNADFKGRASATEVNEKMEAINHATVRGHGSPKSIKASMWAHAIIEGNPDAAFSDTYGEVVIFGEPGRIEVDSHSQMTVITLNSEYEPVVDRNNGELIIMKPELDRIVDDETRENNWPLFKNLRLLFPDEFDDPLFCSYASILGYSSN